MGRMASKEEGGKNSGREMEERILETLKRDL